MKFRLAIGWNVPTEPDGIPAQAVKIGTIFGHAMADDRMIGQSIFPRLAADL